MIISSACIELKFKKKDKKKSYTYIFRENELHKYVNLDA